MDKIKLTQYSHGSGCGCKISPIALNKILQTESHPFSDPKILVGNESSDDAAVFDLGDGTAIMSTTDFFMPVVDDPFTFGRIAAANAISDIYAMGGSPLLAISILGWPVDKLSIEVAAEVVNGGRQTCDEAGIGLAGGHSIDSPEPIFGLAVTGRVDITKIRKNNTATEGCSLFLTKPLGVGILTTAQKKGILKTEHARIASDLMCILNKIGMELALIPGVKAMTDVTGFGLLGHLYEMCIGSNLSSVIEFARIPKLDMLDEYTEKNCIPGGTGRNWESYGHSVELKRPEYKKLLCDPQTSGGLLIAVEQESVPEVKELMNTNHIHTEAFGRLISRQEYLIRIN
jgi:selenide,water dikinase